MATPETSRAGLRERKKQLTRQAILDAAERLFDVHGFDGVTVAQIADAANVSVKTLFSYFDAKEDLVFGAEQAARDALLAAVRDRPRGARPLDAVRGFAEQLIGEIHPEHGMEGFHRTIASPALQARLLVTFDRMEAALADQLAEETGAPPGDPATRLTAAQLVQLIRMLTSQEIRDQVRFHPVPRQRQLLREWVRRLADQLAAGLGDYAERR